MEFDRGNSSDKIIYIHIYISLKTFFEQSLIRF